MHLSQIFSAIDVAMKNNRTVVPILRSELPRPRMLRALSEKAFNADGRPRIPIDPDCGRKIKLDAGDTIIDDTVLDLTLWKTLHSLQEVCAAERTCARRTCNKRALEACEYCKAIQYCGPDCQKKDWKDHRYTCGLQVHKPNDDSDSVTITLPPLTF